MEAISNACGFLCTSTHAVPVQVMKFLRLEAVELDTVIYSNEYKRPKRRNCTVVFLNDSNHESFGVVEYFVEIHKANVSQTVVLALVTLLSTTALTHGLSSELLPHLLEAKKLNDTMKFIPVTSIKKKCILLQFGDKMCVVQPSHDVCVRLSY